MIILPPNRSVGDFVFELRKNIDSLKNNISVNDFINNSQNLSDFGVGIKKEKDLEPEIGDENFFQGGKNEFVKELFASVETSGNTEGDFLQFEKSTLESLVKRGKLDKKFTFNKILEDPKSYDIAASVYIKDLQDVFGIPTMKEAALWSWRPGWYERYNGDIEKIPDDKMVKIKNSKGKIIEVKARQVMLNREKNLLEFLRKNNED